LPHRVVDDFLDGLVEGAKSLGETIASALDKGPLATKGVHRAIDRALDGWWSGLREYGEGLSKMLDHPAEAVKEAK